MKKTRDFKVKPVSNIIRHTISFLFLVSAGYLGRGLVLVAVIIFNDGNINLRNHVDVMAGVLIFILLLFVKRKIK